MAKDREIRKLAAIVVQRIPLTKLRDKKLEKIWCPAWERLIALSEQYDQNPDKRLCAMPEVLK
jgi:hypothetical protein